MPRKNNWIPFANAFCPTGKGGGVDPTCKSSGDSSGDEEQWKAHTAAYEKSNQDSWKEREKEDQEVEERRTKEDRRIRVDRYLEDRRLRDDRQRESAPLKEKLKSLSRKRQRGETDDSVDMESIRTIDERINHVQSRLDKVESIWIREDLRKKTKREREDAKRFDQREKEDAKRERAREKSDHTRLKKIDEQFGVI